MYLAVVVCCLEIVDLAKKAEGISFFSCCRHWEKQLQGMQGKYYIACVCENQLSVHEKAAYDDSIVQQMISGDHLFSLSLLSDAASCTLE